MITTQPSPSIPYLSKMGPLSYLWPPHLLRAPLPCLPRHCYRRQYNKTVFVCMLMCVHVCVFVYTCTCSPLSMCACACVRVHSPVHACMCVSSVCVRVQTSAACLPSTPSPVKADVLGRGPFSRWRQPQPLFRHLLLFLGHLRIALHCKARSKLR